MLPVNQLSETLAGIFQRELAPLTFPDPQSDLMHAAGAPGPVQPLPQKLPITPDELRSLYCGDTAEAGEHEGRKVIGIVEEIRGEWAKVAQPGVRYCGEVVIRFVIA